MSEHDATVPHEGLTHLKTYDVKDSNVEWIGSEIDHKVKYNSAQTEPAWQKAAVGKEAGLFVWRIEQFQVVEWPKQKHGQFHEGDSYIVLSSRKSSDQQDTLQHDIFFWLGDETTQDEAGTAAYKTVELDEFLRGAATQHRELQSAPSNDFLALFPRITLLQGGAETGFRHVEPQEPEKKLDLYRITKIPSGASNSSSGTPSKKATTLVKQVKADVSSLSEDDCFLLDRGDKILIWQGKRASPLEKAKAAQVAHDMTLSRNNVQTEVIAQTDSRSYAFLEPLGGKRGDTIASAPAPSAAQSAASDKGRREKKLFRISDESGSVKFDLVKSRGDKITQSDFDSQDVFLFDTGLPIWVWQGSGASANERAAWLKIVQAYVQSLVGDQVMPVAKVKQGHEGQAFRAALDVA